MNLWTRTNVDGVVTLTINNPPVNALSMAAVVELAESLAHIAQDHPKAVIITGHGDRAFVAGANIKEINALPDVNAGAAFGEVMLRLAATIRNAAFPVIAAINGVAYGGGCELALMCDLRVASSTARLALPEVTLGLMPGWGGSVRVTRRAGTSTALLMALTGDPIDADNCLRLGLVDIVTQPAGDHYAIDEGELARNIGHAAMHHDGHIACHGRGGLGQGDAEFGEFGSDRHVQFSNRSSSHGKASSQRSIRASAWPAL